MIIVNIYRYLNGAVCMIIFIYKSFETIFLKIELVILYECLSSALIVLYEISGHILIFNPPLKFKFLKTNLIDIFLIFICTFHFFFFFLFDSFKILLLFFFIPTGLFILFVECFFLLSFNMIYFQLSFNMYRFSLSYNKVSFQKLAT